MSWKLLVRALLDVEFVQSLIVLVVAVSITLLVISFLEWLVSIFSVGVVVAAIGLCITGLVLNYAVIQPTRTNYKRLVAKEIKNKGNEDEF